MSELRRENRRSGERQTSGRLEAQRGLTPIGGSSGVGLGEEVEREMVFSFASRARWSSSVRGLKIGVTTSSMRTASFFLRNGMPPKVATNGSLPSRGMISLMHFLGPSLVTVVAENFRAILATEDRCLFAKVMSSDLRMAQ